MRHDNVSCPLEHLHSEALGVMEELLQHTDISTLWIYCLLQTVACGGAAIILLHTPIGHVSTHSTT
jgi:hypothetical protein